MKKRQDLRCEGHFCRTFREKQNWHISISRVPHFAQNHLDICQKEPQDGGWRFWVIFLLHTCHNMSLISSVFSIFFDQNPIKRTVIEPYSLITVHFSRLSPCFLDDIWVSAKYQDIKRPLEAYKYQSIRWHAVFFSTILSKTLSIMGYSPDDILVPVPMHWSRYTLRGYDHIGILTNMVAKNCTLSAVPLLKTHWSRRQSRLSRKQRLKNKSSAYFLNTHIHTIPESVILIDDVITTGATLNECAKVLKHHGVKRVRACILSSNFSV